MEEYDSSSSDESVDSRAAAADNWREQSKSWLAGTVQAPTVSNPEDDRAAIQNLRHTKLEFEEVRRSQVLMINSLDRDQQIYPLPTNFKIRLPRIYRNITRLDIVQVKMLSGFYTFSSRYGNTYLPIVDSSGSQFTVVLPDGTYTIQQLVDVLTSSINSVAENGFSYQVSYDCTKGRMSIDSSGNPFELRFFSDLTNNTDLQASYSEWGLGWNLGFGGAPVDLEAATTQTATCFPRLFQDYIYLRLNDTDSMNTIDHTDVENAMISQDPTGQTDHYFGKLLLNNFGCYAQTFIESPKLFQPVLGRLDRLSFQWVDRRGNPLVGPDAMSCDWSMTVRVIEIKDAPTDASTLIKHSN